MEGKVQEQIKQLNELIGAGKLKADDASFGASLCASFEQYGKLTPKQAPWVQKLIDKATVPVPVAIPVGEFSGVVELFKKAKQHLKWPAIVLADESTGDEIKLKMAGDHSQNPGCVYAYVDHEYAGKVKPDGAFVYAKDYHWLSKLLTVLAADPAKVAAEHGKLTGKCCFCNTKLTDPKSTSVGYGPVCAGHYGLLWGEVKVGTQAIKSVFNELAAVTATEEAGDEAYSEAAMDEGPFAPLGYEPGAEANGFVEGLVNELEAVFGPGHVFTEEDPPIELNQQAVENPDYTPPAPKPRVEFEKVPGKAVKNLLEALNAETDA
jgi:hypothetical protein